MDHDSEFRRDADRQMNRSGILLGVIVIVGFLGVGLAVFLR